MYDTITGNNSSNRLEEIKKCLSGLIRHAADTRLRKLVDSPEIEVCELEADFIPGRILANNLAFILISGDLIRIAFKTHFNTDAAKRIAFRVPDGTVASNISEREVFDFVKEYCNLVAGNVVALFEGISIDMGIGLPLCTRGFNEVFTDYEDLASSSIIHSDFWRMRVNDSEFVCSALFEIIDDRPLECLIDYEIVDETNIEGKIEFL